MTWPCCGDDITHLGIWSAPTMARLNSCGIGLLALALAMGMSGCGDSGNGDACGALRVVAAENFYGDLAKHIGGHQVSVTSVLSSPDADPHLFEPGSRTGLLIGQADVVIDNGAGYDDWMNRLLAAAPHQGRREVTAAQVLHVGGVDPNPHLWYDALAMPRIVRAIGAAFVSADHSHAAGYRVGVRRTLRSLRPLEAAVRKLKERHAGVAVAYTERVPGLMLAEAGLRVLTPPGFARAAEDGTEPTAADALRMRQLLTGHEVAALLYNEQATSAATQQLLQLAHTAGVPVVPVTETMPLGSSYVSWQLHQVRLLTEALDR
jgi:zinc/manganese transport system substrate-binding protein